MIWESTPTTGSSLDRQNVIYQVLLLLYPVGASAGLVRTPSKRRFDKSENFTNLTKYRRLVNSQEKSFDDTSIVLPVVVEMVECATEL